MRFTRTSLLRLIKILTAVILIGIIAAYAIWRSLNYARGPEVIVTEPINGSATASSTIVIRGQANRVNNLTINGMPMYISEDGYFGNILIVFPGTNIITLVGYDQFERKTEQTITIIGTGEVITPATAPFISPRATTTTATSTSIATTSVQTGTTTISQ
jgi:hypothetical protein